MKNWIISQAFHIYIYIYIHTYIHPYIHACIHTYIHTYIYKWRNQRGRSSDRTVWRALRRETQSNRESMRPLWFLHLYIPSSATTAFIYWVFLNTSFPYKIPYDLWQFFSLHVLPNILCCGHLIFLAGNVDACLVSSQASTFPPSRHALSVVILCLINRLEEEIRRGGVRF